MIRFSPETNVLPGVLLSAASAMNIFDLPPVNATLNGLSTCLITVIPALRARFDRHRKLGRFTMPIWLYVSITGVIVYFMLYQWYPSTHFEELKKRYELKTRIT